MTRWLLLAVVVAAGPANAQGPATQPAGTGIIVGQVVEAGTGRPVGGAVATIGGPARAQAMTGADGRFVFRDLPKGTFTITAAKGGYIDGGHGRRRPNGPTQPIELADGERAGVLSLPMWRHGAISGTIVDEAGESVVGLTVRVMRRNIISGRRVFAMGAQATTDDRGMYRIPALIPGDYTVVVVSTQTSVPASTADEYNRAMQSNDPDQATLVRAMSEAGALGPLTAATGGATHVADQMLTLGRATPPPPIEGATVFVYPTTYHPAAVALSIATVISLGSGEDRTGADVQLKPVATTRVSGVVMGADGPAAHMPVRLAPTDAAAGEADVATALTDRTGAFTFAAVPIGQYVLRVTRTPRPVGPNLGMTTIQTGNTTIVTRSADPSQVLPGVPDEATLWAAVPIAVGRAEIAGLAVPLRTGLRVSGRMEFEGTAEKPPAQMFNRLTIATELAEGRPQTPFIPPGRIDPAGQFTTYGLPAGRYFVRIAGNPPGWTFKSAVYEGHDVSDVPLDLDGADVTGVVITYTDQPSELSGTVRTSRGGDPDATVIVFPSDSTAWVSNGLNPRRIRTVRTSANGSYKLSGLPPGGYYVAAVPDEIASDWQDPAFLQALAPTATQVTIDDGQKRAQDLRTTTVK